MGLGIGVGLIRNVAGDEEGAAHFRRQLELLRAALAAEGIEGWTEPDDVAEPSAGMRRHVGSFPYSFLHYLRRVYARHAAGMPIVPAADRAALERDDALVADESSMLSSHLLCHSDSAGYYVPVDFPTPCFLDEEIAGAGMVGSSAGLLRELRAIAPALGIALDAGGALSDAEAARLADAGEASPWFREHVVWLALHEACVASVRHHLTVVFV
jgi:hypothetical protein